MLKIQTVQRSDMRVCDSVVLDNGTRCPIITGQVSQVGVISQNGYRYDKGFWNILNQEFIQDAIANREVLGMVEHPIDDEEYLKTPYEKASHVVLDCWVDSDGNPFAKFGLLNNPHGNSIKALIDIGHKPGVSTRGMGEILKDSVSQYVSPDGYAFITWDIVRCPNFQTLKMDRVSDSLKNSSGFKELVQMYHLRDSVDESYNREKLLSDMSSLMTELGNKMNMFKNLI